MANEEQKKEHMPVAFISLGPGHYSKLTLEAYSVLHWCDRLFCFAAMSEGRYRSRAMDSVLQADKRLGTKIEVVDLPMHADRTEAMEAYAALAARLAEVWEAEGLNVGVCVEGSSAVYASVRTVMAMLDERGVPWIELAGVPSFVAAAALAGISLCDQQERLTLLPGNTTAAEMERLLAQEGSNLVIMKPSRCEGEIRRFLTERGDDYECHYFENVTGSNQVYKKGAADILSRQHFPYFSIVIIRR